jgi:hypothetical protein
MLCASPEADRRFSTILDGRFSGAEFGKKFQASFAGMGCVGN